MTKTMTAKDARDAGFIVSQQAGAWRVYKVTAGSTEPTGFPYRTRKQALAGLAQYIGHGDWLDEGIVRPR